MDPKLQGIQQILRRLHLLTLADAIRYVIRSLRLRGSNAAFKRRHPDFPLPPSYLAFDAHGAPNWEWYERSGRETAEMIAGLLRKHMGPQADFAILDWGCGPGRVVRHLSAALGPGVRVYGTDYNPASVRWCQKHLPTATFMQNGLEPPLPFDSKTFACVYAQSVFTHLSPGVASNWVAELTRVLGNLGLLILSTNGDALAPMLLPKERAVRDRDGVVIRGMMKEGRKMFVAFHTPLYVRNALLSSYDVLEHRPEGFLGISQDLWVARVRPSC